MFVYPFEKNCRSHNKEACGGERFQSISITPSLWRIRPVSVIKRCFFVVVLRTTALSSSFSLSLSLSLFFFFGGGRERKGGGVRRRWVCVLCLY